MYGGDEKLSCKWDYRVKSTFEETKEIKTEKLNANLLITYEISIQMVLTTEKY